MKLSVHGATHVGLVREKNEDAFLVDESSHTFAVADGVGGLPGGAIASHAAIEALRAKLSRERPESSAEVGAFIMYAHTAVSRAGRSFAPECIATTFSMVRFVRGGMLIGHVGDSFVLRVRDEKCRPLTVEHNVGNEHRDLLASAPFPPVHPNALTRVLGQLEPLSVDVSEEGVEPGDIVILATDGLTNMLGTESIAHICSVDSDPVSLVDKLISAALRNGGRDNITVVVVSVLES